MLHTPIGIWSKSSRVRSYPLLPPHHLPFSITKRWWRSLWSTRWMDPKKTIVPAVLVCTTLLDFHSKKRQHAIFTIYINDHPRFDVHWKLYLLNVTCIEKSLSIWNWKLRCGTFRHLRGEVLDDFDEDFYQDLSWELPLELGYPLWSTQLHGWFLLFGVVFAAT